MGQFQRVEVQTEAALLVDTALDKLAEELEAKGVVGWEPSEADLEIILINVLAPMAANAAIVASTLLEAAFRKYGVELFKLFHNEGAAATATTKWKLLEEGGKYPARTIEPGLQLEAGGLAFYVEKELKTVEGESEVMLLVVAAERGTEYNGVKGVLSLVNSSNFVSEVTIVGEASGGVDQETDEEYLNRLAAVLELQAPRPITAGNFAQMVLDATTGVEVGRATCIDGYNPETIIIEAKTNLSTTLTEVSTFTGVSLEKVGGAQSHPGSILKWKAKAGVLAPGTTAVSKKAATEMVISVAAEKAEVKGEIEVIGKYEEQRTVTVFVLGKKGAALTTPQRETLKRYLEERREMNYKIYVEPPNYNEVQITATVHCLPGYTESAVVANVKTALENYLSPENWGNPNGTATGSQTWLNATQAFGVVRYNQILGVIESVAGVAYVPSGSSGLAIGLKEAPGTKTADLTLEGPAPLTETKAASIKVTAV